MSSLNFLDTHVWLALVWERHIHSEAARGWFTQREDEQVLFCRFTQLECRSGERIAFLREPDGIDPRLRALARGRLSSPNLWADAYLAAFAATAELRLVTFDKALAAWSVECLLLK